MKKLKRYQSKLRTLFGSRRMMNVELGKCSILSLCFNYTIFSLLAIACCLGLVCAQYDGYQNSYGSAGATGYGSGYENAMDERPKLNLGIRLRIPAFRFELPRFSLPKITVSAKIRQPDKPRVINLPEINLDTTSKVEPPGAKMGAYGGHGSQGSYGGGGGDYGTAASSYGQPQQEKSQTFTFSTGEDTHLSYGNNYANNHHAQQGYQTSSQSPRQTGYMQMGSHGMQQTQGQYQQRYNSPASKPSHMMYNQSPGRAYRSQSFHGAASTISYADSMPDKNSELGFNSPVNASPAQVAREPPRIMSTR